MKRILSLVALLIALAAAPVLAQDPPAEVGAPSANDLHEFTRLLADPRIQGWIADQAAEAEDQGEMFEE